MVKYIKIYFQNSEGAEREIGQCDTYEQGHVIIQVFLDEHNFKSYYFRSWDSDNGKRIDVGSHTEFFRIK